MNLLSSLMEAKKLSYKNRKKLADSDFCIVYTSKTGKKVRKYPIPDISHAINALARVTQFGTSKQKKIVRSKVYERYPSLKKNSAYKKYGKKRASTSSYNDFYENSLMNFGVLSNMLSIKCPKAKIKAKDEFITIKNGKRDATFLATALYQDNKEAGAFIKKVVSFLSN